MMITKLQACLELPGCSMSVKWKRPSCTACAAQTWANWSQFTYLLGHLHSFHASTNVHSVIERSPKSNPTNLCAWQAPPPTRALPLSSSNTANHEHMAHMAGHWLSQNEKSNANWCKLTIQSSAWQKTRSECSGLCGYAFSTAWGRVNICLFLHDSMLCHLFGLGSTSTTAYALSNLAYPFVLWLSRDTLGEWCGASH